MVSSSAREFARSVGPMFHSDMYQEAKSWRDARGNNCQPISWMAAYLRQKGIGPDDKVLAARQEHYLREFRVPEYATDRRATVKAFAEDSWYMDALFKAAGIAPYSSMAPEAGEVFAPGMSQVDKAFGVSTLLTVFPFFWDTKIQEGILAEPVLDVMIMDTTTVNSGTAVHALLNETVADRSPGETAEFGTFQEINVSVAENAIKLRKFGSLINLSDEAMRRQRIPVFQRFLARHGRQIAIDMSSFAIDVTINGDVAQGGGFGAATVIPAAVPGSPAYNDWVNIVTDFKIGYEPTDFLLTKTGLRKVLTIPIFEDPLSGYKFQSTAILPEIMGMQPHRWDDNKSTTWNPLQGDSNIGTGTNVLVVQRNRNLAMYQDGGLSTESDRVLNGEYTQLKTSWIIGFSLWDREAARFGTGFA